MDTYQKLIWEYALKTVLEENTCVKDDPGASDVYMRCKPKTENEKDSKNRHHSDQYLFQSLKTH